MNHLQHRLASTRLGAAAGRRAQLADVDIPRPLIATVRVQRTPDGPRVRVGEGETLPVSEGASAIYHGGTTYRLVWGVK